MYPASFFVNKLTQRDTNYFIITNKVEGKTET